MPIRNKEKLDALAAKLANVPTSDPEYKNWMQRLDKAAQSGNKEAKYTLDKTMEYATADRKGYDGLQEFAMAVTMGVPGISSFVGSKVGEKYGTVGSIVGGMLGGLVGSSHDIMNIGRNIDKTDIISKSILQSPNDSNSNFFMNIKNWTNDNNSINFNNKILSVVNERMLGNYGKDLSVADFVKTHIIDRARNLGKLSAWSHKAMAHDPKKIKVTVFKGDSETPLGFYKPGDVGHFYLSDLDKYGNPVRPNTAVHEIRHSFDDLFDTPAGKRKAIELDFDDADMLRLAYDIDNVGTANSNYWGELIAENSAIRYRLAGMWSLNNNGKMPSVDQLDKYIDSLTADDIMKAMTSSAYFKTMSNNKERVNQNLKYIKYALKYIPATIPFVAKQKQAE